MYFHQTPYTLQKLFPSLLCRVGGQERTVYLTFDDGPTPGVTEEVLDVLAQHGAKATFFCLGRQVQKHPEIFARILSEGHRVGNHGHRHLDGWRTATTTYLDDVVLAEKYIKSGIFRPPYGRLRPAQYTRLKQRYQVVLWDVMPGDFDTTRAPDACYKVLSDYVVTGSIIVLHDSEKAYSRLREILPRFLAEFGQKGYTFGVL